jgi:DNA-binding CsgD family transcriptional regulator/PAS domain-containing protein
MEPSKELRNLKPYEIKLLFSIIQKLSVVGDQYSIRKEVSEDLLRLLKSDFFASFVWNQDRKVFEHCVFLNMDPANLARYDSYYQFHDPITHSLQKRRNATLVSEVMPQDQLERTEFFNDFLGKDGLHHGINLYAYDGDQNIGDLRIWRAKERPAFGKHEALLLNTILPYFCNALRNARIMAKANEIEGFWRQLLENMQIALFLFDADGFLLYENSEAREMERDLSDAGGHTSFSDYIRCVLKENRLETEWGPFSFSILRTVSPQDSRPITAVVAHRSKPKRMDANSLRKRHHLTSREVEICMLVCKGLTDPEIASALNIAYSTVRTHLNNLFTKLDVTTRSELIYILLDGVAEISL